MLAVPRQLDQRPFASLLGPGDRPGCEQVARRSPRRRSRSRARAAAASSSRGRARSCARRPCRRPRPRARRRAPSRPRRGGTGAAPDPAPEARTNLSSSSASGVTQAPIEVANDLPRNGPSGWYSHAWMSRALQSLTSTTPKTWSRNAEAGTGSPSVLPTPTTKPSSSSMSSLRLGPKRGRLVGGGLRLAARPHDRGPADDHGPGAPVVPDREVAPVRQQRVGVGTEESAEVRRVLERRVEVDVVRDRERHVDLGVLQRHEVGAGVDELADARQRVLPRATGRARGTDSGSMPRRRAPRPVRREVEDAVTDAEPDARTVTVDREDAEAHRAVHADRAMPRTRASPCAE